MIGARTDVHTKCCGTLSSIQKKIIKKLTLVLVGGVEYSVLTGRSLFVTCHCPVWDGLRVSQLYEDGIGVESPFLFL